MAALPDIPLPPTIRSRDVDGINGLRMHVLEAGYETKGRPLLLLEFVAGDQEFLRRGRLQRQVGLEGGGDEHRHRRLALRLCRPAAILRKPPGALTPAINLRYQSSTTRSCSPCERAISLTVRAICVRGLVSRPLTFGCAASA